jgi:hypothetical protein
MSTVSSLFALACLLASRVINAQAQSLVYPACSSSWSWVRRALPFIMIIIDPENVRPFLSHTTLSTRALVLLPHTCRAFVTMEVRTIPDSSSTRTDKSIFLSIHDPELGEWKFVYGADGHWGRRGLVQVQHCRLLAYERLRCMPRCQVVLVRPPSLPALVPGRFAHQ